MREVAKYFRLFFLVSFYHFDITLTQIMMIDTVKYVFTSFYITDYFYNTSTFTYLYNLDFSSLEIEKDF